MSVNTTPYQRKFRASWKGDFSNREHVLAGGAKIDAALFPSADATKIAVTAIANADAVTVAVFPLSDAIPAGTTLTFGGKKFATLTALAAKGAVALAVSPLPTALALNDVAFYNAPGTPKRIASGTVVGCTFAEMEAAAVVTDGVPAGLKLGPAADADDLVYIVIEDVIDADKNNNVELYRKGGIVKTNFLPGWANLSAAVKAKIRATYECTVGATES